MRTEPELLAEIDRLKLERDPCGKRPATALSLGIEARIMALEWCLGHDGPVWLTKGPVVTGRKGATNG